MLCSKSRGGSLVMVLIVLALLLIALLSIARSSDTAQLIGRNIAFKKASIQAADIGTIQAVNFLSNLTDPEVSVANLYYATQQASDTYGLPTTINWDQLPVTQSGNYKVQYSLERLCTGSVPIADFSTQCAVDNLPSNGSNKIGAPAYRSNGSVFYRVTVRVTGPKNTLSFVQAILSR